MSGPVRLESGGALAVITLDAPPLNLFDRAMIDGVREAVAAIAVDPPRGLLIRAEGRAVSGGVDVHLFDGLSSADAARLWSELLGLIHTLEELPLPTVFAAHALCLTAAFELALGCDLLLAAESARFGLVETVVGLTPAMGGTQRVAERAGPARARELVMTGGLFDAATLERWGVVNRVLPDEGFDAAARAFASGLAEGPTRAHAATKAIVRAQKEGGARAADALVPELAGALFDTADLRGAVRSFLTEGPGRATFQGR
ncbi:MAG TPA: enoyl-CoA hydratase/isomerase family protein [Solirubrobacteraceae bacterium]|nr:enoyl-CoA hydratase/isomerase family protein [Solirubrobacteraceae bacterium]